MVVDRRAELVEAGLRLLAELRFEDVLNAVETRAIADAAGVSTGSFFHHFRSRHHYAEAVLDRWEELWAQRVGRLATHAEQAADTRGHPGVRDAAALEWEALAAPCTMEAARHVLWALRSQPLGEGSDRTGRELLVAAYASLAATVQADYARGMRAIGREPMPPFDQAEMEVMTTAIAEGLQLRAGVDPEAVRPSLFGDAIAALLLGATRPRSDRGDGASGVELGDLTRRLGAGVHRDRDGRAGVERWRQIADAAAHLFVDRGPNEVQISEVATCADVGVAVVRQEFDSVATVAAAGWARHVPELEQLATAPLADGEDPLLRIQQVLLRYVELVRENRGASEALVAEVMTQARPGGDPPKRDVRALVPIPGILVPLIAELRRTGRLRRRVEIVRLARSLVHLVTMQALLFVDESTARVVDETLTMTFDGALIEPSDG